MHRGLQWPARSSYTRHAARVVLLTITVGLQACGSDTPAKPSNLAAPVYKELDGGGCNVVFISLDTLRADHLGLYGYGRPTSPNLDAFGDEAIVFENAFSASRKTAPSHMSMFTGLYPTVHEVYMTEVSGVSEAAPYRLDDKVPMLAEILRDAGYQTMGWHGGGHISAAYGFERGFDQYEFVTGPWDAAIEWLDQRDERPFFLFLHTYAVHDPYRPSEPYYSMWEGDYQGKIQATRTHAEYWKNVDKDDPADVARLASLYDGAIRSADELMIAPLLEALRQRGLRENTIVIITSDHGEEFGEHGQFKHEQLYDEILHVPLLVYLPPAIDGRPAARRVTAQVSTIDLMPTLLDILDLEFERERLQGRSLVPLLVERTTEDRLVYAAGVRGPWHGDAPRPFHAIRWNGFKLIHDPENESLELYDIVADRGERDELGESAAQSLREMAELLDEIVSLNAKFKTEHGYLSSQEEHGEETLEQLRALGYIE